MSGIDALRNKNLHMKEMYNRHRFRKRLFVIILIPVVILLIGSAIAFGSADIRFADVYGTIFRKIIPGMSSGAAKGHVDIIIWKLRLPRVLMGLLAGIVLGSTGAVMQVVLRNPLGGPLYAGNLVGCRVRSFACNRAGGRGRCGAVYDRGECIHLLSCCRPP